MMIDEQQRHRDEYEHDDEDLTVVRDARKRHAEEKACQQIREQERHHICHCPI